MIKEAMEPRTRSRLRIVVIAVVAIAAACYLFSDKSIRFQEEVQLANGEIIEVARVFKTQSLGEIGGPGGWEAKFNSLVISRPVRPDNPPLWKSEAGLIPIVFDRDPQNGEWFLVATFYTCEAWYNLGRPKLPYAEFRLRNGQWQQGEVSQKSIGHIANVMTGVRSGGEPELLALPAKLVRDAEPKIAPKYLKIVDRWHTTC